MVRELDVFPIEIIEDENVDKSNLINASEVIISFPNDQEVKDSLLNKFHLGF